MRLKIRYKIILIITFIVGVILSGIYFYLNNNLTKHTYERIRTNLLNGTSFAKTYLEEYGYNKNFDEIADKISNDFQVRVTIIALDGTVLGDSELNPQEIAVIENHLYRPEVQEALKKSVGESRRVSTTIKQELLYIAKPFGKIRTKGIVRLAIPLSEIELVSQNLKEVLTVSFGVAFLLSLLLSFLASLLISNPIKDISKLSQSIAEGDFSKRIYIKTNDEIEDLASSINLMSEHIKERINDVISNQSRLEAVLLSMFEGVMVIDNHGTILLMNKALRELVHVSSDPIGKKTIEVIRNLEIQEISDKMLKLKSGVESRELTVLAPEEKILLVHGTPVINAGQNDGAVMVFHDITDLRRLEKVRQDFVANVSHELRTPISTIKGYTETLLDGAIDDRENAIDFLKIIHTDSDRLANLINDLLDLSRIESGKLELERQHISLESIIDKVILILKSKISERKINVSKNIPSDIPKVYVDQTSMAQVFYNLIENAIKYNQKNGSINISAEQKNNQVEISISDTGIGIPEVDLGRIFERFYRVDKAHSRELGGTGLGLAIVKHIVQAHDGEVFVESSLDHGSKFIFTLPIEIK